MFRTRVEVRAVIVQVVLNVSSSASRVLRAHCRVFFCNRQVAHGVHEVHVLRRLDLLRHVHRPRVDHGVVSPLLNLRERVNSQACRQALAQERHCVQYVIDQHFVRHAYTAVDPRRLDLWFLCCCDRRGSPTHRATEDSDLGGSPALCLKPIPGSKHIQVLFLSPLDQSIFVAVRVAVVAHVKQQDAEAHLE
eukprot:CAMPEP_0205908114 /NCGR_PEP_ID=MMETSP1325-20131115/2991_1 /ASSEMBLY_ACC=CAM_ASM_000708 /TAXON_ID=236786 /ORGANISM="Florenciella sp., Strain RCC1007" /LENGTH=191 /DNA_ID=CAMNT_0053274281 /DNA_START=272 /DNA_END=847 /DNA_ORIENTATION=-